jgi:DNA-directed RNA polymerase subunit K/omega
MSITFRRSAASKAGEIAGARARAIAKINSEIGKERGKYLTVIPGQEMIYTAKGQEAVRYLALRQEPSDLRGFPFMAAEAGLTAPTAYELAQVWVNRAAQLKEVASQLEFVRLRAVAAVEASTDQVEIGLIVAEFEVGLRAT